MGNAGTVDPRHAAAASEWGVDRLDVGAYLARIGYDGEPAVTAAVLRDLHRAHAAAIPFENLDIVLGKGVDLDIDRLQAKMIRRARGGYCFEHNLLFAALLERIGFRVTRYVGRVRMGSDQVRPRSHMMLRVDVDDRSWLADVGFGGEGLLEPVAFDDPAPSRQGAWVYRLVTSDGGLRILQSRHGDGWFDLYAFAEEPQHDVDYVSYNWFTSTHPTSPFTRGVVVQRTGDAVRWSLTHTELKTVGADGSADRRNVSPDDMPNVLRTVFGIVLDADERTRLRSVRNVTAERPQLRGSQS
ncbi:MAG TPA: arylamine N-acetyltransferase [Euzebyales bacterium]|nr:arylamine N-acetyltransferase [Euzebyales bacterium]